ncbi:MAG: VOC family protein [Paracoccaceae bacterium]
MAVQRIVANIQTEDPAQLSAFYRDLLGIEPVMEFGWIATLQEPSGDGQSIQLSVASEGGSGTPVPALSIEVDDLDAIYARAADFGAKIEYGPVDEPWGVRRFYVRDPAGTLLNILTHTGEKITK